MVSGLEAIHLPLHIASGLAQDTVALASGVGWREGTLSSTWSLGGQAPPLLQLLLPRGAGVLSFQLGDAAAAGGRGRQRLGRGMPPESPLTRIHKCLATMRTKGAAGQSR